MNQDVSGIIGATDYEQECACDSLAHYIFEMARYFVITRVDRNDKLEQVDYKEQYRNFII